MSTLLENLVPKVLNANKTSLLYKSIKDDINSLQKQVYASKTLYYNATIVSLYGAYERAIKIALEIYADYLKLKCADEKEKEKFKRMNSLFRANSRLLSALEKQRLSITRKTISCLFSASI